MPEALRIGHYPAPVAMDIVPIQLTLPTGDLITLWAPSWREDGEEWEGFLGDEHGVHAFRDAAALTAYVRTVIDHDLADHPAWPLVGELSAAELVPTELVAQHALCGTARDCRARLADYRDAGYELPILFPVGDSHATCIREMAGA